MQGYDEDRHLFGLAHSILRTTFSLVTYYFILRDAELFINFLVRTVTFCYDGYLGTKFNNVRIVAMFKLPATVALVTKLQTFLLLGLLQLP